MNEILPAQENETAEKPPKTGRAVAWLAVLLALVSLGGTGWIWWQGIGVANRNSESQAAELKQQKQDVSDLTGRLRTLETQISNLSAKDPGQRLGKVEQSVDGLEASVAGWKSFQQETAAWTRSMQAAIEGDQARLAGAEARLAALSAREMSGAAELDLAEIDYVLRLAQERLVLFGDTRTATEALHIAEQHIAAFNNPLYLGLQGEIATSLQALAQVNPPNYTDLYNKLDGLQGLVLTLPFKSTQTAATAAEPAEVGWWQRLRNAFSNLVTVRRSTGGEDELPVLADQALVRQQAWLELEVARLAAMRRDQAAFGDALDRFAGLLDLRFDAEGQGMEQSKGYLAALKSLDVDPPLPDISAPLRAMQAIRASGVSAPAPAPQSDLPPAESPTEQSDTEPQAATAAEEPKAGEAEQGAEAQ